MYEEYEYQNDKPLPVDIRQFFEEYVKNNESKMDAIYMNYWDGSNWQSIVFADCEIESPYELLAKDDPEAVEVLAAFARLGGVPYIEGTDTEETDEESGHIFYFTRYAGDPWVCRVDPLNEYEG